MHTIQMSLGPLREMISHRQRHNGDSDRYVASKASNSSSNNDGENPAVTSEFFIVSQIKEGVGIAFNLDVLGVLFPIWPHDVMK